MIPAAAPPMTRDEQPALEAAYQLAGFQQSGAVEAREPLLAEQLQARATPPPSPSVEDAVAAEYSSGLLSPAAPHVPAVEPPTEAYSSFDGLLLLESGRILEGHIVPRADDYLLLFANGQLAVPAADVTATCRSLSEAYEVKRLHASLDDPEARIELARWCWSVGMCDEALAEARAARDLAPESPTIARVVARFEQSMRQANDNPADTRGPARQAGSSAEPPVYDPADRIPDAAYEAFVSQVQPLLMNSCASAGCHGRPTASAATDDAEHATAFVLWRVARSRSSPAIVQQNLQATLQYVDRDHPSSSRLLWEPLGPHGERGRPIFSGRDDPHYRLLVEWVNSLARDPAPHPQPSPHLGEGQA